MKKNQGTMSKIHVFQAQVKSKRACDCRIQNANLDHSRTHKKFGSSIFGIFGILNIKDSPNLQETSSFREYDLLLI